MTFIGSRECDESLHLARGPNFEFHARSIGRRTFGQGSSQANAETQALANLNGKRALRYAGANDSFGAPLTVNVS